MTKKLSRRSFIKAGSTLGVSSVVGGMFLPQLEGSSGLITAGSKKMSGNRGTIDISVAKGKNYFTSTLKAVEHLGDINQFVPQKSRVAILANVQRNNPGTYTKPEIVRAAITLCKKAGAQEINFISWLPEKNWHDTGLKTVIQNEGANLVIVNLRDESLFKPIPVPKGKSLKQARIMKEFFNNDILINIPITKDHAGNKFTGTLKNLMGLNSPKNNRTFHKKNWQTDINDIKYLDQNIADLNTIIKPDLNIVDATEFITTNGPFGPGKLLKPNLVIAGTDRVAIDSYCCRLWSLESKNIMTITQAFEHQLGEIDLNRVSIKQIDA